MTKKDLAELIENTLDHMKLDDGCEVVATHMHSNGVALDEVSVSVINEETDEAYDFTLCIKEDK